MENGKIGGVRSPKSLNRLTQNLARVITLAISPRTQKLKALATCRLVLACMLFKQFWYLFVFSFLTYKIYFLVCFLPHTFSHYTKFYVTPTSSWTECRASHYSKLLAKQRMGHVRVWDNNKAVRLGVGKNANIISNQPTTKVDKNGNS